jgi:hypothetical protein
MMIVLPAFRTDTITPALALADDVVELGTISIVCDGLIVVPVSPPVIVVYGRDSLVICDIHGVREKAKSERKWKRGYTAARVKEQRTMRLERAMN